MIWIGIDTGVHTGLAVWDSVQKRLVECMTMKIHEALLYVINANISCQGDLTVVLEDARMRRWIPREGSVAEWKGRAMGAGSVKRDATIWEDFLKDYRIPYVLQPPKAGLTKWTTDTFARVTGWKERTSNHARDAAMLVFGR